VSYQATSIVPEVGLGNRFRDGVAGNERADKLAGELLRGRAPTPPCR
jgi:hypothetical protein